MTAGLPKVHSPVRIPPFRTRASDPFDPAAVCAPFLTPDTAKFFASWSMLQQSNVQLADVGGDLEGTAGYIQCNLADIQCGVHAQQHRSRSIHRWKHAC